MEVVEEQPQRRRSVRR